MPSLLEMSAMGGILTAVIVVIRALAMHRLPKNAFLALWAVALCRLLIPFTLPSPASLYAAAGRLLPAARPGALTQGTEATTAAAVGTAVMSPLPLLWLTGAAVCALFFLVCHMRGWGRYRCALPVECELVRRQMEEQPLRRQVRVLCSDRIDAPLTYGVLHPVILLPACMDWADETRLSFILTHEHTHIRRFDALWKWLLAAALCLHWFNPMAWVMYVLTCRDLELTCDESVVRRYGASARAPYALTLVGMEEQRAHFTPLASGFAKNALEERITAIMKLKKTTVAGVLAALALVAVAVAVFATSAPRRENAQPIAAQSFTRSGGAVVTRDYGFTAVQEGTGVQTGVSEVHMSSWEDLSPAYTEAEYNRLMKALRIPNYEKLSIAEFNRALNAVFQSDDWEEGGVNATYERILMTMPADDPGADFLLNTVQASLTEYSARLDEVFSGKKVDPSFPGSAERHREEDVFGERVRTHTAEASYRFTYRILDQDKLTVAARDQFLQAVLAGGQGYLDGTTMDQLVADKNGEAGFKAALEAAGKAASGDHIAFTGCTVNYFGNYAY